MRGWLDKANVETERKFSPNGTFTILLIKMISYFLISSTRNRFLWSKNRFGHNYEEEFKIFNCISPMWNGSKIRRP